MGVSHTIPGDSGDALSHKSLLRDLSDLGDLSPDPGCRLQAVFMPQLDKNNRSIVHFFERLIFVTEILICLFKCNIFYIFKISLSATFSC